jgi:hypothetical protein
MPEQKHGLIPSPRPSKNGAGWFMLRFIERISVNSMERKVCDPASKA